MENLTCASCGMQSPIGTPTCPACGMLLSSTTQTSSTDPTQQGGNGATGPILMGLGCLAPFALAGLSLLAMSAAVGGRGGSGLVMIPAFFGGLVIGVPLFIVGIVMSVRGAR